MALSPDYCSLAELKNFLRISDAADDAELAVAITAASRAIDHACNRQFGKTDTAETWTFYYDTNQNIINVPDIASLTGFGLAGYTSAGFTFHPQNALVRGRPIEGLVPISTTSITPTDDTITVTAVWGWPSVPTGIKQATLLQASRFFKRRDAPFGVAGSAELGSELRLLERLDPDVGVLVGVYRRHWGVV